MGSVTEGGARYFALGFVSRWGGLWPGYFSNYWYLFIGNCSGVALADDSLGLSY